MKFNIESLGLSNRSIHALVRHKIYHIEDILEMNAYDLISMRNFGIGSALELMNAMRPLGFNKWADSISLDLHDAVKSKNKPKMFANLSKLINKNSRNDRGIRDDMMLFTISGDYDGGTIKGD